jgi:gamma-glutamylcyclotransferase (GGCT)/AIG2-like uncharacterized protein YtfP
MAGGTEFRFVTEGIHAALDQARTAAGARDVRVGGGVSTIRQYLGGGLIDELHLAMRPVLLGTGEHLLNGIDLRALGYECEELRRRRTHATHVFLRKRPLLGSRPMPLLFSCGTLSRRRAVVDVRKAAQGQPDELPGFEASISVTQQHANVVFNGGADSRVGGTVFEITDAELAAADEYEQRAKYVRITATLASGKQAWVYVDGSIALRHAVLADVPAIAGLVTQLGYPTAAAVMEPRLRRMLSLSHHAIVVAESSGEVVGVAGAGVDHGV